MIDNKLIESALKLTGKSIDDMEEAIHEPNTTGKYKFSIEKFCYYLLSPEFIENLYEKSAINIAYRNKNDIAEIFGDAIYEYQSGRKKHLIYLLEKIG